MFVHKLPPHIINSPLFSLKDQHHVVQSKNLPIPSSNNSNPVDVDVGQLRDPSGTGNVHLGD